ncbi:MAG: response regulator [Candidatus Zixiibacteriota bacterium]|nr:MAG: response regulator [candidate division Zixibacteria bacterium]
MKKIVVAESSPTIRSVAENLLRQNGYNVVCTSDGLQAWEVINSERPDLVLAGLNLSGITGLELCRQISGDKTVGGIPVVVVTGAKDGFAEDELKSAGARGRLKKPFSPRDLLIIVKRLIGEGETENRDAPASKVESKSTKYKARVLSTTRHLENTRNDVYNLDWADLNDTGSQEILLTDDGAGVSDTEDEQGIKVIKDQYDLASLNAVSEENVGSKAGSSDDEDYDWFIGEMQKETSADSATPRTGEETGRDDTAEKKSDLSSADEELNFEDFGSPDTKIPVPEKKRIGEKAPPAQKEPDGAEVTGPGISDDDLSKIADVVTQNLAAAIVAKIDRQKIVEIVRSVIKK